VRSLGLNVLFVHEVDWLQKVVFDIHTLAESLSLLGHQVYAIDYENTWQHNGFFGLGTLRTEELDGVSRAFSGSWVSLRRPGFIRIPGLSRLSAGLTHYLEIKKTIKDKNIDVIVLYGVATNGLQTVRLGRRFNVPVVFRSIDIANQLVPYSYLRLPTRVMEKRLYSSVDMILTLTPGLSGYVIKLGAPEKKVKLLPMPVDTRLFHPSPPPEELARRWGITRDDMVIVYIGTLFDFSGLDMVIRQFYRVLREIPQAKLLIVGDGPQRQKLKSTIRQARLLKKVFITGFQPYDTMPQFINLATVCLNPFLITGATRDIFPGKIVQYLACAKPIVATPLPGLVAVTPGEEQGLVYAATPEDMTEKLVELLGDSAYRERVGNNGLDYVRRIHSYESIASQLEARLKEAISTK